MNIRIGKMNNRKWRRENPESWAAAKKRNYDKGAGPKFRHYRPWNIDEMVACLHDHSRTDRELAIKIGRTVRAIQQKRVALKKIRYLVYL